jgi:hypothetical protein
MIAIAMLLFFAMILVWLLAPTGGEQVDIAESGPTLVPGDATA